MFVTELKCLSEMPMFRDIGMSKLKLVAIAGSNEQYSTGQPIVQAGDPPGAVLIVLEGEIEIVRETSEVSVPIAGFGTGYIIGDISVLLGQPYTVTVVAISPVNVLRLDADVFLQLIGDVPQFSMALMRDLGRRVLTLTKLFAEAQS